MKTQFCKLFLVAFAMFASAACERESKQNPQPSAHGHGTPKDWQFTLPAGRAQEGRKLFVEAECHKCHEIKGEIPRSFGPPPLPKGAIGGFSVVALNVAQLIFICCVVPTGT